jgi:hypothetical protein
MLLRSHGDCTSYTRTALERRVSPLPFEGKTALGLLWGFADTLHFWEVASHFLDRGCMHGIHLFLLPSPPIVPPTRLRVPSLSAWPIRFRATLLRPGSPSGDAGQPTPSARDVGVRRFVLVFFSKCAKQRTQCRDMACNGGALGPQIVHMPIVQCMRTRGLVSRPQLPIAE